MAVENPTNPSSLAPPAEPASATQSSSDQPEAAATTTATEATATEMIGPFRKAAVWVQIRRTFMKPKQKKIKNKWPSGQLASPSRRWPVLTYEEEQAEGAAEALEWEKIKAAPEVTAPEGGW